MSPTSYQLLHPAMYLQTFRYRFFAFAGAKILQKYCKSKLSHEKYFAGGADGRQQRGSLNDLKVLKVFMVIKVFLYLTTFSIIHFERAFHCSG